MGGGPSFRVAGIPVRIDLSFFLIVLLFGFGTRSLPLLVTWAIVVAGSVLLHELGHAVAFRIFGQQPSIVLHGMGGLTSGSGEPLSPARDLVVSLAGPLSALVLLGLPALWIDRTSGPLSPTAETIVSDLVFVNLAWSLVNLLPVLPLDGGRVTAALWALRTGKADLRPAHVISMIVAGGGAAYALSKGSIFGAMFAGFFAAYNVSQLSGYRNSSLGDLLVEGWRALGAGNPVAAEKAAQQVLADRPNAQIIAAANELLSGSRLVQGDNQGARDALVRFPPGTSADPMLLAAIAIDSGDSDEALDWLVQGYAAGRFGPATAGVADAVAKAGLEQRLADRLLAEGGPGPSAVAQLAVHLHTAGRFAEAAAVGRRALDSGAEKPGQVAYNLACSHARAGQTSAALDWLERAADLDFADVALLDGDPDLDALRSDERYLALRARLDPRAGT